MKKNIFLLFNLFLVQLCCNAQGVWTELPPQIPQAIQSIHFSDNDHGYITCTKNKIYKTSDGGLSWTNVSPNFSVDSNNNYKQICTLDSLTAFAGSDYSFMIRTYDGGITWDSVSSPLYQILDINFINDSVGFIQGNGIQKTYDRGNTWTLINNNYYSQGMYFITDSIGFAGTSGNGIYKTNNQGLTWTMYDTKMNQGSQGIYFFDLNHGIAVDGDGYWSVTYDQGLTWDTTSHGVHLNQVGIYFVNPTTGFKIYSNSGNQFMSSYDGGITWTTVLSGNCSGLSDMHFPSNCVGYIGGLSGKVFKYTDSTCIATLDLPSHENNTATIHVFPNPVTENLTIVNDGNEPSEFILYDISFRQLLNQKYTSSFSIDARSFSKGIYFYTINNKYGLIKSDKLIKE